MLKGDAAPNLFTSLFEFHPRDGHTPKENFLTESFAYLLRTDEAVRIRWLSCLFGRPVQPVTWEISTRRSEKDLDSDTSIYPDLVLEGLFSGGEPFAVFCEHKWDSACDREQLVRYYKLTVRKGKHARLAFVGASRKQRLDAASSFPDNSCRCFLWEDVFRELGAVLDKSFLLTEFLVDRLR